MPCKRNKLFYFFEHALLKTSYLQQNFEYIKRLLDEGMHSVCTNKLLLRKKHVAITKARCIPEVLSENNLKVAKTAVCQRLC